MTRKAPTLETLRALFAKSGNICAFPGCKHALINKKNQFVGQVCHICAAEPGGERYDPSMTDEDRRGYENLVLLCYPHHVETDDVLEFSAEKLRKIKRDHEDKFGDKPFKIDESRLYFISQEFDRYWRDLKKLAVDEQASRYMAMPVFLEEEYQELLDNIEQALNNLSELNLRFRQEEHQLSSRVQKYLETKYNLDFTDEWEFKDFHYLFQMSWEFRNLAVPNIEQQTMMRFKQLEIRVLSDYLKLGGLGIWVEERIKRAKSDLEHLIKSATIHD